VRLPPSNSVRKKYQKKYGLVQAAYTRWTLQRRTLRHGICLLELDLLNDGIHRKHSFS
jgi:hypothetical protein